MPFLAPLIPALIGGAASAGAGALVNAAVGGGGGGQKASGYQAPSLGVTQTGTSDQGLIAPVSGEQSQANNDLIHAGLAGQGQFAAAAQAQNGLQNQSNVYGQLQNVAAGVGPNPAQAMLNQATGTNVSNQAALIAGQRGGASNVGLLARQAAQQGGQLQQQSAGQAATLQANQSLGALGQAGQIAGQQVANYQQGVQGFNADVQNNQALLNAAIQNQNANQLTQQGQQTSANSQIANTNAGIQGHAVAGAIGGATNGIGGALGQAAQSALKPGAPTPAPGLYTTGDPAIGLAHGGQVENPKLAAVAPEHRFPSHLKLPPHLHDVATIYHGNKFGDVERVPKLAFGGTMPMKQGGHVPGKAQVSGDSLKNDNVKALLSPGEVVIPRSVMQSDDPVGNAAKFVAAIQKKKGSSQPESDFKQALGRAIKNRKSK